MKRHKILHSYPENMVASEGDARWLRDLKTKLRREYRKRGTVLRKAKAARKKAKDALRKVEAAKAAAETRQTAESMGLTLDHMTGKAKMTDQQWAWVRSQGGGRVLAVMA
jgi:hypothetical protein